MKAVILAEPISASAMHTEPDHLKDVLACVLYNYVWKPCNFLTVMLENVVLATMLNTVYSIRQPLQLHKRKRQPLIYS